MRILSEDRYGSLKLLPWWDQAKVSQAKYMVVGAGALGNEILKNLALVGAGNILIVDFDLVEASNLTRSVLFRMADIGKSKAETAASRVKELNPDVKTAYINGDITSDIGLGLIGEFDAILIGLDNFKARIFLSRSCEKTGVPWINGGIHEMIGEVHVFIPGNGACYECNLPQDAYKEFHNRLSCNIPIEDIDQGKVPTTPTIASIIAAIQVQEALKLLHGIEVKCGSGLIFNGLTNEYLSVNFPRNPECPYHGRLNPIIRINRSIEDITVKEVLNIFNNKTNIDGSIELGFDLIYNLSCACGKILQCARKLDQMKAIDFKCPSCGRLMEPAMTSTLDRSFSALLHKPLSHCCVPPLSLVTVRNGSSVLHLEFSGGKENILNFS